MQDRLPKQKWPKIMQPPTKSNVACRPMLGYTARALSFTCFFWASWCWIHSCAPGLHFHRHLEQISTAMPTLCVRTLPTESTVVAWRAETCHLFGKVGLSKSPRVEMANPIVFVWVETWRRHESCVLMGILQRGRLGVLHRTSFGSYPNQLHPWVSGWTRNVHWHVCPVREEEQVVLWGEERRHLFY